MFTFFQQIGILLLLFISQHSYSQKDNSAVQITQLKEGIAKDTQILKRSRAELEQSERTIIELQRDTDTLTAQLQDLSYEIEELELSKRQTISELPKLKKTIAKILRTQYELQQQSHIKLFLSNQDPSTKRRILRYYRYLFAAQKSRLEQATNSIAEIESISQRLLMQLEDSRQVKNQFHDKTTKLLDEQASRALLVSGIEQRIRSDSRLLNVIKAEHHQLQNLATNLHTPRPATSTPTQTMPSMVSLKGALTPPINGKIVTRFQQKDLHSDIPSTGVVIQAAEGTDIRSIYSGQVVYSDWFRGFGLLLVLDHGDNMLSLYGYNSELLFPEGHKVAPNTVIARVGSTGGRAQAELYFEIRRAGKPLDPLAWVNR